MKKLVSYSLLGTALFAMTFTSCKKEDNDSGSNGNVTTEGLSTGQAIVKAKISGAHSTDYASAIKASAGFKLNGDITISSTSDPADISKMDAFTIVLPGDIKTGTYKIQDWSSGTANFIFSHSATMGQLGTAWTVGNGDSSDFSFTITKVSGAEIEGSFKGEMSSVKSSSQNITKVAVDGSFAAKF